MAVELFGRITSHDPNPAKDFRLGRSLGSGEEDQLVLLAGTSLSSGLVSWKMSPSCGVTVDISNGASWTGDVALEGARVMGGLVSLS